MSLQNYRRDAESEIRLIKQYCFIILCSNHDVYKFSGFLNGDNAQQAEINTRAVIRGIPIPGSARESLYFVLQCKLNHKQFFISFYHS